MVKPTIGLCKQDVPTNRQHASLSVLSVGMFGESMISKPAIAFWPAKRGPNLSVNEHLSCIEYILLLKRVFEKLYDDIFEAFHRTPSIISSKPYLERALRLVQSGLSIVNEMQEICGR